MSKMNSPAPTACNCQVFTCSTSDFPPNINQSLASQPTFPKGFVPTDPYFEISRRQSDRWKVAKKQIIRQRYLTCEAEGAFADVLWGGWWLTSCNARGAIHAAVRVYQAGITYILTKLSKPSWGTNTLEANSKIFLRSGNTTWGNKMHHTRRRVCQTYSQWFFLSGFSCWLTVLLFSSSILAEQRWNHVLFQSWFLPCLQLLKF